MMNYILISLLIIVNPVILVGQDTLSTSYIKIEKAYIEQRFQDCINFSTEEIMQSPEQADVYLLRAACFYELDRTNKALKDIEQCLNINSNHKNCLTLSAYLKLSRINRYNKKLHQEIEYLLSIDSLNSDAHFLMASSFAVAEKYDKSIYHCLESIRLNSFSFGISEDDAYSLLPHAYYELEDYENAIEYATYLLDKNNSSTVLHKDLLLERRAESYTQIKEYELSIRDWEKYMKLNNVTNEELDVAVYRKAFNYFKLQEYEKALTYLDTLIKSEISNRKKEIYTHHLRGRIRTKMGDYDGALADFKKSRRIFYNPPLFFYFYSEFFYEKGDYKKAIKHINKALRRHKGWSHAYYLRGKIKYKQKEFNLGCKDIKKAYDLGVEIESKYKEECNCCR